jgi:hypothetical protein
MTTFEKKVIERRSTVYTIIYDLTEIPPELIHIVTDYDDKINECHINKCGTIRSPDTKVCDKHLENSFRCDSCHEFFVKKEDNIVCVNCPCKRKVFFNRCLTCQKHLKGIDERVIYGFSEAFHRMKNKLELCVPGLKTVKMTYNFIYTCPQIRKYFIITTYIRQDRSKVCFVDKLRELIAEADASHKYRIRNRLQYIDNYLSSLQQRTCCQGETCPECGERLAPDDVFVCEDGHKSHKPCVIVTGKDDCLFSSCKKKIVNMNEVEKEIMEDCLEGVC